MEYNQTIKTLFPDANIVRSILGQIRSKETVLITCDVVYGVQIPVSVLSYIAPVMRAAIDIPQAEVIMVMKPFPSEGYTFNEMQYGGMLISSHFVQFIHEYYPDIEHRVKVVLDNVSLLPIASKKKYDLSNIPTDEKEFINWIFPNRPHDFDRIIRMDTQNSSQKWLPFMNLIQKFNPKTCIVNQLIAQVDQNPEKYSLCDEALIYGSPRGGLYPYGIPDSTKDLFNQIEEFNVEDQQKRLKKNYYILLQDFSKTRLFYPPGRISDQTLIDGYSQMQKFVNKWVQ